MKRTQIRLAAPLAALTAATALVADDIVPAPWRGTGLYTFQEWEFTQPNLPLPPDGTLATINPGSPLLTSVGGATWTANFDDTGLDGYIGSSNALLVFDIPNFVDFEPVKWIRIQINGIWQPGAEPGVVAIQGFDNEVGTAIDVQFIDSDEHFPGFHRWEDWYIFPNPDFEQITLAIPPLTFVNQVVIETTSVPEPSTVGLIAGAFAVTFAALRRHRSA